MDFKQYDVVIVGGGAAGMMAAAQLSGEGAKVALVEKNSQLGRKLLLTGKGRCNLTNSRPWEDFKDHIHPDSGFFRPSFMSFSNSDTVAFFNSIGLQTVSERGMRIFPASGRSQDVRNVLESYIGKSDNVDVHLDSEAVSVLHSPNGHFVVEIMVTSGRIRMLQLIAGSVIIATGGLSYPSTGSTGDGYRFATAFGHNIVQTRPSLTALVPYNYNYSLVGLNLRNVSLSLIVDGGEVQSELGELSFTGGGLEGALGFRVSRRAVIALDEGKKVEVVIDLKPAVTEADLKNRIEREYSNNVKLQRFLERFLPVQAVKPFMDANPNLSVSSLPVRLKNWRMQIREYVGYHRAVVTSGGVDLRDVSRKTMESKLVEGLYFAGEVLDLDADTGGYNLQIAFSTGAAAARAVVERISG